MAVKVAAIGNYVTFVYFDSYCESDYRPALQLMQAILKFPLSLTSFPYIVPTMRVEMSAILCVLEFLSFTR